MLKFVFSLGFLLVFILPGQAQLNSYKYIIVPKKFDGFKKENQFRTSTQIKHLFTESGFTAIYEDQIPPDLAGNPCLGLRVLLLENSSLLATRVTLGLRDCNGAMIYESAEGKSKVKDYELAYREAINGAFFSFTELGYAYTLSRAENLPADEVSDLPVSQELTDGSSNAKEMPEPGIDSTVVGVVETPVTEEVMSANPSDVAAGSAKVAAAGGVAVEVQGKSGEELWYAQPIENGYQLVDSTPSIRMNLLKTAQKDTYIATVDGEPMGMVYKKDGQWWHEFFKDGKTEVQPLTLKF